jgi:hypothetical protein
MRKTHASGQKIEPYARFEARNLASSIDRHRLTEVQPRITTTNGEAVRRNRLGM